MSDEATWALLLGGVALALGGLWGLRRERPVGRVSFVPWSALLFVGLTAFAVAAAHLISLKTGQPLPPRGF